MCYRSAGSSADTRKLFRYVIVDETASPETNLNKKADDYHAFSEFPYLLGEVKEESRRVDRENYDQHYAGFLYECRNQIVKIGFGLLRKTGKRPHEPFKNEVKDKG